MRPMILLGGIVLLLGNVLSADSRSQPQVANCYTPIEGGWHIHIAGTAPGQAGSTPQIGMVVDDPRLHRRPLYPPADKAMIWNKAEMAKIERYAFRPLIIAYNEPRFLFDFHSAGGLLGHLFIGLSSDGRGKWFYQWSDIEVSYTDGRMEYTLKDAEFPGVTVSLAATPLANSAGVIVKVRVDGSSDKASIVWGYGGASAFSTNYVTNAPEFTFSPNQCSKDLIRWNGRSFTLVRAFDQSDVYMSEVYAVARYLPGWKAMIHAGSSSQGQTGFGDPKAFASSPAGLLQATDWAATGEKGNCVAVQEIPIGKQQAETFIVVGMGGNIEDAIVQPQKAWKAALARNRDIAGRVVTHTPDPYLDASARMIAFATEGTWGDSAIVHGGWSWRFAYLGWRTWYGPDCYGWTDRVKRCIQNHTRISLVRDEPDKGALGSLLEYEAGVYYNMDEVFLDHVRHYFDYTNDIELMREIFPILQGVVERENRRLQPGNQYLYENALNTWISDSHWYTQGQCTQASAYMLQANNLLADLARRLGKDDTPYRERAEHIRAAMQRRLWMRRPGVFAEYRDTRGSRMIHPEPELPTIYHSAEFGAADPLQVYQMLHWTDTHLGSVTTPNGGKQYWSSNWFPNAGRSYSHSTYEMAYAEELNFTLTDYLGGRADEAYALVKSTLCGIFNGPTPGGLSCHAFWDGRQRANDEFADAISMWGRTITEGLFGIVPERPDGVVELTPQFPSDWPQASIHTRHFSYRWERKGGTESLEWESPVKTAVHLHLPVRAKNIERVLVDGADIEYNLEPGCGLTWVEVKTPTGVRGSIVVSYKPGGVRIPDESTVKEGDELTISLPDAHVTGFSDPQGILDGGRLENGVLRGITACDPGPALLFLSVGGDQCPSLVPVRLHIEPRIPVPPMKVWSAPKVLERDLQPWTLVDLKGTFNASVTEVLQHVADSAQPPPLPASDVGFTYWKDHLIARSLNSGQPPSDAAWRKKVGPDGIAWTTDGIPFKTSKEGPNIGVVTLAGGYPARLEFPVKASGRMLYLMISGMTFPVQSHVVNLRVTLRYADGQTDQHDLVSPFGIGDCWSIWCGRWHDTAANGFENIGGRFGPGGSSEVPDITKPISTDTEAHLVPFELRQGTELQSVEIEAVANDVIFGVMGATIQR